MIILLTLLAVARMTRVITTDTLFEAPRNAVVTWLLIGKEELPRSTGFRSKLAYLIVCDWCASMYVGAAGAGAYAAWGETMPFMVVILALSGSYAAGFLASVTERGE
jgi:hypothetical protein